MIQIDWGILAVQVVTFLIAIVFLWKLAWGPMTRLLVERRQKIQKDLEAAEQARRQMEELKASFEKQLADIDAKTRGSIARAREEGQKVKEQILRSAQEEARRNLEKARLEIQEESRRALAAVKSEVARLSVVATEKILRRSIDRKLQDEFLRDALSELDKHSKELQ